MKSLLRVTANGLWLALCLPENLRFRRAARDVAGAQRRLLLDVLRRNAETEFGRQYDFASINSIADYQSRVPLSTYEDYQQHVARISSGRQRVLTRDPVLLLEPTSGSSAATKLIPYTSSLKHELQHAIAPWIADLYLYDPQLMCGQTYWSVTPVTRRGERTAGGIPVGFEEDSEYLGGFERALSQSVMAVPSLVKLIDEMEAFRYVTLLFLLRSRALGLISVWNPTFLTLLTDRLAEWWQALADDIARGTITAPAPIAADLLARLRALNRPDKKRAGEIRDAFTAGNDPGEIHSHLWPHLRLVSCWTDANAARYAAALEGLFPQARVQGKGLLATEGFVSFPLTGRAGAALALRSHFLEFLPVAGDGEVDREHPRLAHELDEGQRYSVVLTTGGGLYRYQLNDVIEVVGRFRDCPLIRFVGRAANVSDWFGEKLNEIHVSRVLEDALKACAVRPTFAMLACELALPLPAYTLFIESHNLSDETQGTLGRHIEAGLVENYHYRYCRRLGQLDEVRVFRVEGGAIPAYLTACQSRGQRAGDVKPVALDRLDGWAQIFRGRFTGRQNIASVSER